MTTRTYQTNLRCAGCVATITPRLDGNSRIRSWSADVKSPEKSLTIESDDLSFDAVESLLEADGYKILRELTPVPAVPPVVAPTEAPVTYLPLVLLIAMIAAAAGAFEIAAGSFDAIRSMRHFMAGFFLCFAFFKLLDVTAFALTYRMYDLVAARIPAYGFVYPFLEAALGFAYLANVAPLAVNFATLALMLIGTAGVVVSLFKKRKVKCACLGAVFNLPMSWVTLIEDVSMAIMAVVMLAM